MGTQEEKTRGHYGSDLWSLLSGQTDLRPKRVLTAQRSGNRRPRVSKKKQDQRPLSSWSLVFQCRGGRICDRRES